MTDKSLGASPPSSGPGSSLQPQAASTAIPDATCDVQWQLDRLISAGFRLSNCAFNLAQRGGSTLHAWDAQTLKECYEEWDERIAAYRAAMREGSLPDRANPARDESPKAIEPGPEGAPK